MTMDTDTQQPEDSMSAEKASSPAETVPSSFTRMQGALWIVGLIGIAAIGGYYLLPQGSWLADILGSGTEVRPGLMAKEVREGQYESAVAQRDAVLADPDTTSEQKALALSATLGAEYRISGDLNQRIEDIVEMKKYILDPAVSVETRVNLLNMLAAQYPISGGDARIFEETFKDAPFSDFKATSEANVDRNARLSSRNLFEWSYSTMPTAFAAISIARWYSEQYSFDRSLDEEKKKSYAALAAEYLKKAEDAAAAESERFGNAYLDSTAHLTYRHWRAVTIGRLRAQIGEPYKSMYIQEYEDLFVFQKGQNNKLAAEYLLYSRMFFASQLRGDAKIDYAKQQLDTLAAEMNAVTNPDVNVFFSFLRTEYKERPTGPTYVNLISSNFELSPAFEEAVTRVVSGQ